MALLMIPDSARIPGRVMNQKYDCATSRPPPTPISPSGIVSRAIAIRRIELTCATSRSRMMRPPIGAFSVTDRFAPEEVSAAPPNS